MKKAFYLLTFGLLMTVQQLWAMPGDTTWVQSQTDVQMNHYGNFDSAITFPNGSVSYRRIFMIFELGKYQCPGNPQYCYDWDYTVTTHIMTPNGDTLELGRLITPYADQTLGARMPLNWKGKYVFDVTDYAPILKNNATIRVSYSGYSWGFTATVKFLFIEGTPERNTIGFDKVWAKTYDYGYGNTPINTALANVSLTAPAGTVSAAAKFTITGHGGDATAAAAEFYPNSYTLNLNNNLLVTQNFWRDNCGFNNYYPQNGTWVYDRANWCPGDLVHPFSHPLTGITAGNNFTINATFPPYTSTPSSSGSHAVYSIQNVVVYYGALNKTTDASLEDIIAPTNAEAHFRENPLVGKPRVIVRNAGSNTISSIKFEYGIAGTTMQQYTWNGTLNSLENATIELDECAALKTATGTDNHFIVTILEVNGQADDDATDDVLHSYFDAAPVWTGKILIEMQTNNSTNAGLSESSWKIVDVDGNIIAQRANNAPNTYYADTVRLGSSSYQLIVEDAGCDGMKWWANPSGGTGFILVSSLNDGNVYDLKGYFGGDFGCGFKQYFTIDPATAVINHQQQNKTINIFPNPAKSDITIALDGFNTINGNIQIVDAVGKVVYQEAITQSRKNISVATLSGGIYFVKFIDASQQKLPIQKLVITR
jgi:hypothetical protein